jgi:hypothetical protein
MPQQVEIRIGGGKFAAGMLFIKGAGLELGLDLNTRELREPSFYRAVVVRCMPLARLPRHGARLLTHVIAPGAQAEFVGTLFFLFFTIVTVVYRTDFAGGIVKPSRADVATTDFVDLIGTVGSAAQLMIAASFGCARACVLMACDEARADERAIGSRAA